MQELLPPGDSRPPKRPWLRRIVVTAFVCYGIYGLWRTFPRFDHRLVGSWTIRDLNDPPASITFFARGGGRRGNVHGERQFRWWTCGNRLIMHPDRGSRSENIKQAAGYAIRTLLFMELPYDLTEFQIAKLECSAAQFEKRPRIYETGVTESLVLGR